MRIEQGRGNASPAAVRRIGEALKLDRAELDYVLALTTDEVDKRHICSDSIISPSVLRVMHAQAPRPAYIINTRMDLLAWNGCACAFYGLDWSRLPLEDRNVLWLMLTNAVLRERVQDWQEQTRRLALRCRALWTAAHTDPATGALIERMSVASQLFREWWTGPLTEVIDLGPISKTVHHPRLGALAVEQTAWQFGDKSDHILILSAPVDTPTNNTTEKLARLAGGRAADGT